MAASSECRILEMTEYAVKRPCLLSQSTDTQWRCPKKKIWYEQLQQKQELCWEEGYPAELDATATGLQVNRRKRMKYLNNHKKWINHLSHYISRRGCHLKNAFHYLQLLIEKTIIHYLLKKKKSVHCMQFPCWLKAYKIHEWPLLLFFLSQSVSCTLFCCCLTFTAM